MSTPLQYSQLLLLVAVAAQHLMLDAAAQQEPITLPGCPDKCGDISIPFPFGMKPGCFRPGFEVTCNDSFNPPRAFLAYKGDGSGSFQDMGDLYASPVAPYVIQTVLTKRSSWPVELMDISVARSEARAYGAVRSDCSTNSTDHSLKLQLTRLDAPFLVSRRRNAMVGVGWNVEALFAPMLLMTGGYGLSCHSQLTSENLKLATNGSCSGLGCCAVDLAQGLYVSSYGVSFEIKNNSLWHSNPCSYGMLVERSWYNFSTEDMYGHEVLSIKYARGVPLVLNFTGGNGPCPAQGQQPPRDYACVSGNSSCADVTDPTADLRQYYVCRCWEHYDGNPYITNGCQDIDECELRKQSPELRDKYPCSSDGICENKPGGYDCPCKSGMKGDGKIGNCTEILDPNKLPPRAKVYIGVAAFIVAFFLVVMGYMAHHLLKLKRNYKHNGGPVLKGVKNIRIYTKKQMKQITNNYKHIIGEGHFGKVYLGTLKDKEQVAIKKSIKVDRDMKQVFTDEVIIQSEMRHKNIVRLVGCCLQMDVPMLVYEYVESGSLYDVLFKRRDVIPVHTRLRIAIGSAEGLTYMHSAGESTIRHGDVKSANILLDKNFTPKVSDFGTSRLLARGKIETTEHVIGDMSYIDPIYMEEGVVTQKSDVYSFGIVLIELITRRAAIYDEKRSYTANFVEACLRTRARDHFDTDITSELDINLLEMVSGVAVECLKPNPEERLDMKQVEHRLFQIDGQSRHHHGQESN